MTVNIPNPFAAERRLKTYIALLLIALGACLYQLHENSIQLAKDFIVLRLCMAAGAPTVPEDHPQHYQIPQHKI